MDIGLEESDKVKDIINGKTKTVTTDSGMLIKEMARVFISGQMGSFMMGNGS